MPVPRARGAGRRRAPEVGHLTSSCAVCCRRLRQGTGDLSGRPLADVQLRLLAVPPARASDSHQLRGKPRQQSHEQRQHDHSCAAFSQQPVA